MPFSQNIVLQLLKSNILSSSVLKSVLKRQLFETLLGIICPYSAKYAATHLAICIHESILLVNC